jgi:hypothetical protein
MRLSVKFLAPTKQNNNNKKSNKIVVYIPEREKRYAVK